MIKATQQTTTTMLYHNNNYIDVLAYSFSPYNVPAQSFTSNKVFMDILYLLPRTSETMTLRVTVPAHLICQPKDVVEATVHREVRQALSFQGATKIHPAA